MACQIALSADPFILIAVLPILTGKLAEATHDRGPHCHSLMTQRVCRGSGQRTGEPLIQSIRGMPDDMAGKW